MINCLKCIDWKKGGIFAAGVIFGTAGIRLLSSKDARKVYTCGAAAVLRGKEYVMRNVSLLQENVEDILAEAEQINEERKAREAANAHTGETTEQAEEASAEEE